MEKIEQKDPGVKVGVTSIIVREGKILLGLRGDACETARNEWAYPGGRMDYGEDPITSIAREVHEETFMYVRKKDIKFLTWVNEFFPEDNKHYVSLVFWMTNLKGDPIVTEKDKCKEWRWFDPDDLPDNTFWASKLNIKKYRDRIKNG
jgi:8-oxo-dGTP diphosphatase